jgi:hypothetical protein
MRLTPKLICAEMQPTFAQRRIPCLAGAIGRAIPEGPDRIIVVTLTPGAGPSHEYAFEDTTFQVRCRGAELNYESAESLAFEVDNWLLSLQMPWHLGPTNDPAIVTALGWVGGPPSQLGDDDQGRMSFVGNYFARSATDF